MSYLYKKTGDRFAMFKGNVVRYELESVLIAVYNETTNKLILKSTNGTDFSQSSSISAFPRSISDITYSNQLDKFVAVGNGWTAGALKPLIIHSEGSSNWQIATNSLNNGDNLQSIVYSEDLGIFVSVGTNLPIWSTDGINWTKSTTPTFGGHTDVIWVSSLSKFLAVKSTSSPYIAESFDGKNWSTYTGLPIIDVAYSDTLNLFVGIADSIGDFCVSATGSTWTDLGLTMSVPITFTDIAWSPVEEVFVAVGVASTYPSNPARQVAYSYDGYTWATASCPPNDWIRVIWSNEFQSFYATPIGNYNQSETFMKSTDGINWTEIISGSFSGGNVRAIASGKYIL